MVRWRVLSSRSLDGMPLAWGAKAHAGTCHRDLFFLQAAEGQGALACSDWYSGFLFSWDVLGLPDLQTSYTRPLFHAFLN
jgi:hypothetical protein